MPSLLCALNLKFPNSSAVQYQDPVTQASWPLLPPRWCGESGAPIMLTALPGITRADIEQGTRSIWRYRAAFPVPISQPITLGEGCTPLIQSAFRGLDCQFKLEWFAPTGSFKDRGSSVMLSLLREQDISEVLEDSSGNGGASIAAYGVAGGMAVKVLAPEGTSAAKLAQIRAYGADIELVPGSREDTAAAAIEQSTERFYASHNWHPFFLQGTKTLGYELWEDSGFALPDNIVIPVGAGSLLLGCYLAFTELLAAGEIERMPRLFASQPQHCAPVHAAFNAADGAADFAEFKPTVAEGTAIQRPVRMPLLVQALRESGGGSVAVSEKNIVAVSLELAQQGLFVEPSCAHAAAGFAALVEEGLMSKDEKTVVVLTGTGLKSSEFYTQQFD
ncbi:MAG: threonine synthase [Gammaproteobacteria bacterium]|nr:threonine synthase [Gammaproteobacteria bacterium]